MVLCEVCGRPSNKTCFACGLKFCDFCTRKLHWKGGVGLHYPVSNAPGHLRAKLAEKELEKKIEEDGRARLMVRVCAAPKSGDTARFTSNAPVTVRTDHGRLFRPMAGDCCPYIVKYTPNTHTDYPDYCPYIVQYTPNTPPTHDVNPFVLPDARATPTSGTTPSSRRFAGSRKSWWRERCCLGTVTLARSVHALP